LPGAETSFAVDLRYTGASFIIGPEGPRKCPI
jgi:hypothetical protein